jgi:hypothetical protein
MTAGADERRSLDYSQAMTSAGLKYSRAFAVPLTLRRIAFTLGISVLFGLWFSTRNVAPTELVIARAAVVGLAAMLGFSLLERWPRGLPGWLPRWSLQLLGVVAAVSVGAWCAYWMTTGGNPDFPHHFDRYRGYRDLIFVGSLFAPLVTLGAIVCQREALARKPASSQDRIAPAAPLRWLRASVGQAVRSIAIEEVDFLRAEQKYTTVAWCDETGRAREGLMRMPLKDLIAQLDPARFAQVHRSVVVNLRSISHITRGENETADLYLRNRGDVLPVSRRYLHLFRRM